MDHMNIREGFIFVGETDTSSGGIGRALGAASDYRSQMWMEITHRWGRATQDKPFKGKRVKIVYKRGERHHVIDTSSRADG